MKTRFSKSITISVIARRDVGDLELTVHIEREREIGERTEEHGRVRTQTTVEEIAAGAADHDVVAAEGRDGVIACQRVDEVRAVGADQYVVAGGCNRHGLGRQCSRGSGEYHLRHSLRIMEPADDAQPQTIELKGRRRREASVRRSDLRSRDR